MSIRQCKKSMRRILTGKKSAPSCTGKTGTLGRSLALAPFGVLLSGMALASPQGGQVVGGTGTIQQPSATQTIVNQQTQKMAIDWQSFNLAAGEMVRFYQPSSSATVLNRILDQNPSQIFGSIQAMAASSSPTPTASSSARVPPSMSAVSWPLR